MAFKMMTAALAVLLLAGGAFAQTGKCTRASILAQIAAVPEYSTVAAAITALNATLLIPNQAGKGTFFLPNDNAFKQLGVPVSTLLGADADKTLSILAYHSLLHTGKTLNRAALVKNSPIQSDLGVLLGENLPLKFAETKNANNSKTFGGETVSGIAKNNTIAIRKSTVICGYRVYELDGVLIPAASLATVPTGLQAVLGGLPKSTKAPKGVAALAASGGVDGVAGSSAAGPAGSAAGSASGPSGSTASASGPSGSAPAPAPQGASATRAAGALAVVSAAAALLLA